MADHSFPYARLLTGAYKLSDYISLLMPLRRLVACRFSLNEDKFYIQVLVEGEPLVHGKSDTQVKLVIMQACYLP